MTNAESTRLWKLTKKGVTAAMYTSQRSSSKTRKMEQPDYSLDEFREWIYTKPEFHTLFESWVESGYAKKSKPSCDRLDDFVPYRLDNIQVISFDENERKRKPRMYKPTDMLSLDGTFEMSFSGCTEAAEYLGMPKSRSNIVAACNGKRETALNKKWRYSS